MPASVVKTPEDERLWNKAKGLAAEQGHTENWAYIMGIFQRMKGEKTAMMAPTDIFKFYVVDRNHDPVGAAEALSRYLPHGDGKEALQRGLLAPVSRARDLYDMVRPFGYAVRGQDIGKVGPTFRPQADRVASRFLEAYDEKGRSPDPEVGWQHGEVEPFAPTEGEGSQTPPAHDNQGEEIDPPKLEPIEIPGYDWHDKSKGFHSITASDPLEWAALQIEEALDILDGVATTLDGGPRPTPADENRVVARVAADLRQDVSHRLAGMARALRGR